MDPKDLKYAATHEWLAPAGDDGVATIGLSKFAVDALTDVVHLELPETGRNLTPGEPFGEIESVKAVSDLYSPVAGEVVAVNADLVERLESLGDDCYDGGWMIKVRLTDEAAASDLLDYAAYEKLCAEES